MNIFALFNITIGYVLNKKFEFLYEHETMTLDKLQKPSNIELFEIAEYDFNIII
jgi:hypothetical protein